MNDTTHANGQPAINGQAHEPTVVELVTDYLAYAEHLLGAHTLERRRLQLARFVECFGSRTPSQCRKSALEVWLKEQTTWKANDTRKGALIAIHRVFNWAVGDDRILKNPFKGISHPASQPRRALTDREFAVALRAAAPPFKRFLMVLALTGCRPGELTALRWQNIDEAGGRAILQRHKTSRKTGKPRIIYLPPPALKLLAWCRRNYHPEVCRVDIAATHLYRILIACPERTAPAISVWRKLQALGYSNRLYYLARQLLGVVNRRVGGFSEDGFHVVTLPAGVPPPALTNGIDPAGHVFLNSKGLPWTHSSWGLQWRRLRKRAGLPPDAVLHGVRHRYVSAAIKRTGHIKAVATLVGHVDTRMVEAVYCHIDQDVEFMRQAASAAVGLASMPALVTPGAAAAAPAESPEVRRLVRLLERKLEREEAAPQSVPPERLALPAPERPEQPALEPAQEMAYKAWCWAREHNPALVQDGKSNAKAVYLWILEHAPELRDYLPPSVSAFRRYLNYAHCLLEGGAPRSRYAERRRREMNERIAPQLLLLPYYPDVAS